jgi:hypothetical protein
MPTATKLPRPLPPIELSFVDPNSGRVRQDWYEYLKIMDALVRALRLEIP